MFNRGEFVNSIIKLGGLAAATVLLSACATITRGTSQKYNIETTPTEANVKLSTGQTCISPCKLKLKRKDGFIVTASKDGYKDATATVESKVRAGGVAGVAGNVLIGGIIGAAVDGTNGSMNDLTPNPLHLKLEPVFASEQAPAQAAASVTYQAPADAAAPAAAAPTTAGK